jgi:hypothetical protein
MKTFPMNVFDDEAELANSQVAELFLTLALAGVTLEQARAYARRTALPDFTWGMGTL